MPISPVADLRVHPYNEKIYKADADQDLTLLESIRNYGIVSPLIVTPSNFIVSGNRRYHAALTLGLDKVPITVKHFKDTDDEIEFLILSNLYRLKTKEEVIREGKKLAEIAVRRGDGRVRDQVGGKIGMSGRTFEKGSEVVDKIDELAEVDPEKAEHLRERLNKSVDGAFKEMEEVDDDVEAVLEEKEQESLYEAEVAKLEKQRTLFYLPDLKELLRVMDATHRRLAPKRTATTPAAVGHMIGNIKDMHGRLMSWLPDGMVQCTICGGTGKVSAEDRDGNPTDVFCGACINGLAGLYKESEN